MMRATTVTPGRKPSLLTWLLVFEKSPGGLMDKDVGIRLREEIYAKGGSREIDDSITAFLGRDRSLQPFFEYIGLGDSSL